MIGLLVFVCPCALSMHVDVSLEKTSHVFSSIIRAARLCLVHAVSDWRAFTLYPQPFKISQVPFVLQVLGP